MLQKYFMVLLLILVSACSSQKQITMNKKAELYYSSGTQALIGQRYTEALQYLSKANDLNPKHPDILNNLGMAYYFKDHKKLAVETINKAIEIDKNNSDAKSNLAVIAMKEGENKKAEALLQDILKDLVYDKQAITYYNLGILSMQKKDMFQAREYFTKSILEDSTYCPSHFRLGMFSYQERKFKKAMEYFRDASMGVCYQDPAPAYYQALTFIEMRKFDDARIKLAEVETRFPRSNYAQKARQKIMNLSDIESHSNNKLYHAGGSKMESPEF